MLIIRIVALRDGNRTMYCTCRQCPWAFAPSDRGDAIEEIDDDGTNGVLEQKGFKINIDNIG